MAFSHFTLWVVYNEQMLVFLCHEISLISISLCLEYCLNSKHSCGHQVFTSIGLYKYGWVKVMHHIFNFTQDVNYPPLSSSVYPVFMIWLLPQNLVCSTARWGESWWVKDDRSLKSNSLLIQTWVYSIWKVESRGRQSEKQPVRRGRDLLLLKIFFPVLLFSSEDFLKYFSCN